MKRCLLLIMLLVGCTFSLVANAYTGWCTTEGGPKRLNFTFDTTITDFNNADAGTLLTDVYHWQIPGDYEVVCDQEPGTKSYTWFKADSNLPISHTDSHGAFYKVNEYLSAQTRIYIYNSGGNWYQYVPFTDVSNGTNNDHSSPSSGWASGTEGYVSLYIERKMAATTVIPPVAIAQLYASMTQGSYGSEPIAQVYMSGTITVPQSCVINAGTSIHVDFGNIYADEFTHKGERPESAKVERIDMPIKCSNIEATANLTLRFIGTASADEPQALQSNNPNIGFMLTDSNQQVVVPNSGTVPFQLDDDVSESANVTIYAYPVSTTGIPPTEGTFQSIAVIRADFA